MEVPGVDTGIAGYMTRAATFSTFLLEFSGAIIDEHIDQLNCKVPGSSITLLGQHEVIVALQSCCFETGLPY